MTNRSYTATLRYATNSYQKMNVIAKIIRGKPVDRSIDTLSMLPKKSAKVLLKVVKSAYANVANNTDADTSDLVVQTVNVWRGKLIKRMRFVSRSGVHRYIKHRSFVRVVLGHKA